MLWNELLLLSILLLLLLLELKTLLLLVLLLLVLLLLLLLIVMLLLLLLLLLLQLEMGFLLQWSKLIMDSDTSNNVDIACSRKMEAPETRRSVGGRL